MVKKTLAILLLAAITTVSFLTAPINAEAKPLPPKKAATLVPPHIREADELKAISERFDVKYNTLKKYFDMGWGFKDLRRASILSLASNKTVGEVLVLKENNSWPRVEYIMGITPNDVKSARDKNDARYFAKKLDVSETEILVVLEKNYSLGDVLHSVLFAKETGISSEKIINMHNPPEYTWRDVASDLGISYLKFIEIRDKINEYK